VKLANRILDLINKHYIKRERSEGHGDILMSGMCVELYCISLHFPSNLSIYFFVLPFDRGLTYERPRLWKKNVLVGLLPRIGKADTVDKARLERVRTLFAAPELDEESLGDMGLSAS
jgi:hypothetical protein